VQAGPQDPGRMVPLGLLAGGKKRRQGPFRKAVQTHDLFGVPLGKPILLSAHMDVVPVEPGTEADWTHPPFAGAVADGFVWGRGAMDMKSSLMGILEGVEYLLNRGMAPRRTVYLAFGHDEEVGGNGGAAKIAGLLAERGVRLDFTLDEGLVIADGIVPGVSRPAALIGLAEKGKVSLELVARGECGHSSMPPVSTAVGGIGRALHRLETNQMPAALKSPVS
jgi:carboxypeptidase PM20D1